MKDDQLMHVCVLYEIPRYPLPTRLPSYMYLRCMDALKSDNLFRWKCQAMEFI